MVEGKVERARDPEFGNKLVPVTIEIPHPIGPVGTECLIRDVDSYGDFGPDAGRSKLRRITLTGTEVQQLQRWDASETDHAGCSFNETMKLCQPSGFPKDGKYSIHGWCWFDRLELEGVPR